MREAVCALVKYHSFPPFAIDGEESERKLLRIAANGELTSGFSLRKLYLLGIADIMGRKCVDSGHHLNNVEYFIMMADELGCADQPYSFASAFAKRAYLSGRGVGRSVDIFNDSYGEVVLLSGLPGTGKDTWIEANCKDLPVISLDSFREKMSISPTDNQSAVIAAAHEQARELLRKKQSFVWNATNITAQMRAKQIALFEQYNASVTTVFLETEWNTQLKRNSSRKAEVPQNVIGRMLSKLELPESFESEHVIWRTV